MTSPAPYVPDNFPDTVLSVAGLTDYLRSLLETDEQLIQVWVTGEVSSASPHSSGLFFTIQSPQDQVALNCVVWKSLLPQLVATPQPGETVVVLGRIRLYGARSQYQLTVYQCLPAGEGMRSLRFRQLRSRLESEGLFDADRKRPLPLHPQTIAVVTSPQAAAWGDIQRTLKRRYPGLKVLLSPAIVQGDQAPRSIAAALDRVGRDGRAEVVILARGGGATEDLACFNDEGVVRAIVTCPVPVVSGIGHQRDESLADLAADLAAHTPTAAAATVVPELDQLLADQELLRHQLQDALIQVLETEQDRLYHLQTQLQPQRLRQLLTQQQRQVTDLRRRSLLQIRQRLAQAQQQCHSLGQTLTALDPEAVLQRGYAIVRQQRKAPELPTLVRSVQDLQPGDRLSVQLQDGAIEVQVL